MSNDKKKTKLQVFDRLPKLAKAVPAAKSTILIYDQILSKVTPGFKAWIKQFDLAVPVRAGEKLKTLEQVDKLARTVLSSSRTWSRSQTAVFVAGGGSVGDFGGFFASIFLRGVDVIHIPTTWLAALDSAHGGKTALNVLSVKNQIGSFHMPREVWLVRSFFQNQKDATLADASGEAAKATLLDLKTWKKISGRKPAQDMWSLLPSLVDVKLKYVQKDPFETKGRRVFLNLGHTLGHAIESHFGISHGHSVRLGLFFALWVSARKKVLAPGQLETLEKDLERTWGFDRNEIRRFRRPSREKLRSLVMRDKKMKDSGSLRFVALKSIGKPAELALPVDEFLALVEEYWIQ